MDKILSTDILFQLILSCAETEIVSLCIIGGGVSGLTAAITTMEQIQEQKTDNVLTTVSSSKVMLLEKSTTLGGRVKSDTTPDGYTLDRGFAVFIEEYPFSKKIFDYDALKLGKFLPGSLVKLRDGNTSKKSESEDEYDPLCKLADPLRVPSDLIPSLLTPLGTTFDKIRVLPLLFNVLTNSIEELFEQEETDTLTCLKYRYGFSNKFIEEFFTPFLEGIYLCSLQEQSSRMFHFIFKMFAEGSATLPQGGIGKMFLFTYQENMYDIIINLFTLYDFDTGKIVEQLATKAENLGVKIQVHKEVLSVTVPESNGKNCYYEIRTSDSTCIKSKSVILATDSQVTQKILSSFPGFEYLTAVPEQIQRSVGNIYYGFNTSLPCSDPILILNGAERAPVDMYPINNVCFPSVVTSGYAPEGYHLCSVTLLEPALTKFEENNLNMEEIDDIVRHQLQSWFPKFAKDIETKWEMKGMYKIPNAQPGQLRGDIPASVNGGRNCTIYRGKMLPEGLFLCGDHMSTASLNGALESAVNAGQEAAKFI